MYLKTMIYIRDVVIRFTFYSIRPLLKSLIFKIYERSLDNVQDLRKVIIISQKVRTISLLRNST